MRIFLLMQRGSPHGIFIGHALARRGVPLCGVVLVEGPPIWTNLRRTWRADGLRGVAWAGMRRLMPRGRRERGEGCRAVDALREDALAYYNEGDVGVVRGDQVNGPRTIAALRAARPDLLLLGGCGILGPELLAIPRIGTLNAHPGWLPDYRGVDVVAWCLHDGEIPGATVHWVDAGVDAGDIILRRRLPDGAFDSLAAARRAVTQLAAELMAEAVQLVIGGTAPRLAQSAASRPAFRLMSSRTRHAVEAALRKHSKIRVVNAPLATAP